jgi:hypothetical protein
MLTLIPSPSPSSCQRKREELTLGSYATADRFDSSLFARLVLSSVLECISPQPPLPPPRSRSPDTPVSPASSARVHVPASALHKVLSMSPASSPSDDVDPPLTFAFSRAIIVRGGSSDAAQVDSSHERNGVTDGPGVHADDGAAEAIIAAAAQVAASVGVQHRRAAE